MGNLTVKYINVNKDTKLEDFICGSTVHDIISALQDMGEDVTVIKIEQYEGTQGEKLALIRDLCRGNKSPCVICTEA